MQIFLDVAGMLGFPQGSPGAELLEVIRQFDPAFGSVHRSALLWLPDPERPVKPGQVLVTDDSDKAIDWNQSGGHAIYVRGWDDTVELVLAKLVELRRAEIAAPQLARKRA